MREIKFRAWDGKANNYVYGLTIRDIYDAGVFGERSDIDTPAIGNPGNYVFGQYTGLKDKNGKEIYEGDLLKADDQIRPYEVLYRCAKFMIERQMHPNFGDKDYGWIIADLTESHYFDGDEKVKDCEVIGNIYENPDLIK